MGGLGGLDIHTVEEQSSILTVRLSVDSEDVGGCGGPDAALGL